MVSCSSLSLSPVTSSTNPNKPVITTRKTRYQLVSYCIVITCARLRNLWEVNIDITNTTPLSPSLLSPSLCLSVYLSLSLSLCLSVSLSLCLPPSVCLSLSLSPSLCLSVYLSLPFYVSLPLSVCLCLSPSLCLSVYLSLPFSISLPLSVSFSLSPSICLSVYLSPSFSILTSLKNQYDDLWKNPSCKLNVTQYNYITFQPSRKPVNQVRHGTF